MRVLFTTVPQVGHMFPMVPLAWALRCAGGEVLVTTPSPEFGDRVTGAGLPTAVIGDLRLEEYARVSVIAESTGPLAADLEVSGRGWGALAARTCGAMLDLVDSFRPDLVVSEPAEFAGRMAAHRRGVAWVEHSWGLPAPPGFARAAAAELAPELAELGLDRLPAPAAIVHPSPASLWPAGSPHGIAMRYVPYNGPAVLHSRRARTDGTRRILLTFGSLLVRHGPAETGEFLRKLVEELTGSGFELVLGLDSALVRDLEPLPAGVVHTGWVPLNLALSDCDLVVHHGGSGTSLAAAAAGLPQLVTPQSTDQFVTAAALADYGSALRFLPEQAAPATIRDAAGRLLDEPCFTERARALCDEVSRLPGPAVVAERLRGLAGTGQGRL